ncbi:hypothetical protein HED60_06830 [Planctomycetales bacterium ZRK34]|nr:hypothetical protein HED60_06830 [Planctomycetales bacterium ZRK34]
MNTRRNTPISGCRGLTLAEALLAIVILQIAVLGLVYTVTAGHAHTAYGSQSVEASQVAESMMEEILTHEYADPEGGTGLGPDTGESARTTFDDIDDYNGSEETLGNLLDANGDLWPSNIQHFSRSVTVALSDQTITDLATTVSGKLITVTVTGDQNASATLIRFVPSP